MRNSSGSAIVLFLALFLSIALPSYSISLKYTLNFRNAQTHYIDVTIKIDSISEDQLLLKIPVWTPGSYMVREFAKNIESVKCYSGDAEVSIQKTRKNTWQVNTYGKRELTITYSYYANELTVRTCHTDDEHAFINPSNICMFAEGHKDVESQIEFIPYPSWEKISTPLPAVDENKWIRKAANYDELADSPVEIGNHQSLFFSHKGAEHEIAIFGNVNYREQKVISDFKKIIDECVNIYHDLPYKRYVFFSQHFKGGGGGLEHKNSCSLQSGVDNFDSLPAYKNYLALVAHEYFHLWNIKRLRPAPLGPFDYDNENYTALLWIAEGFTSYYDDLITYRAGFISREEYLKVFAGSVSYLYHTPGTLIQPLAEASFDAWIKYYRPNENSSNATTSYYTKGSVVAWLLDLEIIKNSGGKKNLDDLMYAMYNKYSVELNRAYTYEEFLNMANAVSGISLEPFFKKYVFDTGGLPQADELKRAGIELSIKPDSALSFGAGFKTDNSSGRPKVTNVVRNTEAWKAGINTDDYILKLNDVEVKNNFDSLYASIAVESTVSYSIVRRNKNKIIAVIKKMNPVYRVQILQGRENSDLYEKWLKKS